MSVSQRQYAFQRESAAPGGSPRLAYVSRAQYSPEWNSSLHTHGCAELFFITGGHGRFRTRREEFPVAIHDAVIVNANVPHTEASQLDSPLEYAVLGVEGLETMAGAEGYALLHLHSGWEELMGCLHLMLQEAEGALPGYERVCRSLLDVVLVRLNRQRPFRRALRRPVKPGVRPGPAVHRQSFQGEPEPGPIGPAGPSEQVLPGPRLPPGVRRVPHQLLELPPH